MKSRTRSRGASLAGWLFADLAIVLSLVFLQSSIVGGESVEIEEYEAPSTSTTTAETESGSGRGVSILACKVKFLSAPNLDDGYQIYSNLKDKVSETTCANIDQFGVILVYAGNQDIGDDVIARGNADKVCDSLFSYWEAIDRKTTYCEGFKNDGITSNYFDLTLFPYIEQTDP